MTIHRQGGYDDGPEGQPITAAALGATSVNNGAGTSIWAAPGRKGYPGDLCVLYEDQRTTWTDRAYTGSEYWAAWVFCDDNPTSQMPFSEWRSTSVIKGQACFGTAGRLQLVNAGATVDQTTPSMINQWLWVVHHIDQAGPTQTLLIKDIVGATLDTLTGACSTGAFTRHREGRMITPATGRLSVDEGIIADTLPTTTFVPNLKYAWAGDWTHNSFAVVTHTQGATSVRARALIGGVPVATGAAQTPDADGRSRHALTGLVPDTNYDYEAQSFDGSNWISIGGNGA